ncbi:MAG: uridylate kinase [Methanoregulaceae archaeon]|nr:uridylate kinase [Methanoregulaceae archaeon]
MVRKFQSPPAGPPVVLKVGGSLHTSIPDLVPVFLGSGRALYIVPGGGMFADAVRKIPVHDDSAHWMAIAAMDQYGWFIASHGITATAHLQVPDRPVVFLPYCSVHKTDPLPHSWDVTSDSIAAWVADRLGLDLVLLKSVDGILENGSLMQQVKTPVKTEVVDQFFIPFVLKKEVKTTIINGSCVDRVEKFLRGESVSGTRIGTTF